MRRISHRSRCAAGETSPPTSRTRSPRSRRRAATVLYVALRAVDSLKTLLTPFLPFTSQVVHELLGYDGWIAGPLEFETIVEEDGSSHEVLTGDYASWVGSWQPSELPSGQALAEPRPLFRKLPPEVADEELARLVQ